LKPEPGSSRTAEITAPPSRLSHQPRLALARPVPLLGTTARRTIGCREALARDELAPRTGAHVLRPGRVLDRATAGRGSGTTAIADIVVGVPTTTTTASRRRTAAVAAEVAAQSVLLRDETCLALRRAVALVNAAARCAVGRREALARDELARRPLADVLGAGGVGDGRARSGGSWMTRVSNAPRWHAGA
jgi:hypothetical protein